MIKKPTFEELEQRVKELEKEITELKRKVRSSEADEDRKGLYEELKHIEHGEIFKAIPDAVVFADLNRNITKINPGFTRLFGYEPKEIYGKKTKILYANEEEFKKQGETRYNPDAREMYQPYEIDYRRKNGDIFRSETVGTPVRNEKDEAIGLLAIVRDISDKKQAEVALQKSELWLKSIFNSLEEAVFVVTPDRKLVNINNAALRIFGYSQEELTGQSTEVGHVDQAHYMEFGRRIKEAFDKGESANFEFETKRKNGEIFPTEHTVSLLKNDQGKPLGIVSVLRDITDRKQAEEALRESEEKYRSMMEAMKDPVSICSPDYRIEYMNPAMIKRTGHDATGERCFKAVHDLDEKCPWCRHHETQSGDHFETDIVSPKDNRSYLVSHSPIFHEGGSISKMTIFRDTTDLKKMEAQLQQAQKMEAIGTLAGGIAHDFNNILSPIMIHSEMAMMDLPADNPLQKSLKQIYKAGERARDLVKQILTFARRREEERAPIQISLIIKEVIKFLRSTISSTIDIKYDFKTEQDTVLSDPTQMNQIIMNLCTNASHAMEENGGALEVILNNESIDSESGDGFPDLEPGRYVKLTVKDTGQGIEPQFMDKIFEPYFTTKEVGKGTGMGLALVHGIAKSYGGTVTAQSEVGKGTSFHVYLPLIEGDTDVLETTQDSLQLPTGTERILFVDDEKVTVDTIQSMLERLGYKVTGRTSSIEALEAFRNNPDAFDLIITDMTMPNMTGKDLAKELMTIRPDIPIILCTGFSEKIDEKRAEEMGISAFVMKPIVMGQIANTIREVIGDKK